MNWVSAHSTQENYELAWNEVRAQIQQEIVGDVNFLLIFVSSHGSQSWESLARYASSAFPQARIAGGSTRGTISSVQAFEKGASIVAMAAHFEGESRMDVHHLSPDTAELRRTLRTIDWAGVHGALLISDPYTADGEGLLNAMEEARPNLPWVGGSLCGGETQGERALWSNAGLHREGALMILLRGKLRLVPMLAQGVVPVGDPYIVMKRRGNLIDEFDAGVPVDVVRSTFQSPPAAHAVRWEQLVLGVDIHDDDLSMQPPDYVMRSIVGADPKSGALAVDARMRAYQTVRFHMRDPQIARQELRIMLAATRRRHPAGDLKAAIIFNNEARDSSFYQTSNVDAHEIATACAPAPSIGMFSKEEFGAANQQVALHQFGVAVGWIYEATS